MTESKALQAQKALEPISVTPFPISAKVNELQPKKALFPIIVILS